jgi:hypothetical protein
LSPPTKCLVGVSGLVCRRPPAPKGGRGLQEGRSGGHRGWKRGSRRAKPQSRPGSKPSDEHSHPPSCRNRATLGCAGRNESHNKLQKQWSHMIMAFMQLALTDSMFGSRSVTWLTSHNMSKGPHRSLAMAGSGAGHREPLRKVTVMKRHRRQLPLTRPCGLVARCWRCRHPGDLLGPSSTGKAFESTQESITNRFFLAHCRMSPCD